MADNKSPQQQALEIYARIFAIIRSDENYEGKPLFDQIELKNLTRSNDPLHLGKEDLNFLRSEGLIVASTISSGGESEKALKVDVANLWALAEGQKASLSTPELHTLPKPGESMVFTTWLARLSEEAQAKQEAARTHAGAIYETIYQAFAEEWDKNTIPDELGIDTDKCQIRHSGLSRLNLKRADVVFLDREGLIDSSDDDETLDLAELYKLSQNQRKSVDIDKLRSSAQLPAPGQPARQPSRLAI